MKKLLTLCLLAVSMCALAQNKKIALLEPRTGDGTTVSGMEKAMVRGELRKAIVNHTGYEAFTRSDIDQLMNEQGFQRTGNVSEEDIHKLGEMSGADYICVSTLNKSNTEFYLEAYLIDIESGAISNPASQFGELVGGKLSNMLPVCQALAQELLDTTNSEKLFGKTRTSNTSQFGELGNNQIQQYASSQTETASHTILTKVGKIYNYGDTEMDKKQYADFLNRNCKSAYSKYQTGEKLKIAGWSTLGSGLALAMLSPIGFACDKPMLANIGTFVGGPLFVSGVVMLPIGYVYVKQSVDIFNNSRKASVISFNLQASQNGLGLALNF